MRCWHHSVWSVALAVVTATLGTSVTEAQELALAERGPRFLFAAAPSAAPKPVDIRRTPVLRQRIALDVDGATLTEALAEITRQSGLAFVYSRDVVSGESRVHLRAEQITVAAALTEILLDAGVDVLLSSGGQAALVKRTEVAVAQTGSVAGRVTDTKTGQGLEGAEVIVNGTRWRTLTGTDGQYRLADVDTGTYVVMARRIGYTRQSRSVTVAEGEEARADFALQAAVTKLDELVTTGTMIPTEVKALPTPVTIISETDIAAQRPRTVQEIFRQAVPSAVSWDLANGPTQTTFSVRGASDLSDGSGEMKVFVDGIEVANRTNAFVDPNSIARIEVVRGPQAAAIYGSDAVGGVIQVFTKRGDSSLTHPQLDGEAAVGVIQTPYAEYDAVLRQQYRGAISGGGPGMSYHFGAGYTHTPDWVQPVSAQSNASVHGGVRLTRGPLTVDVSGRHQLQTTPGVFNPDFASSGLANFSKPFYRPLKRRAQTVGARLTLRAASWWHHRVTTGIDRLHSDQTQTQPRLTVPADTFLSYFNQDETKTSIGYNTTLTGALARATTGSLTVGFDHYGLPVTRWFTATAPLTSPSTGNIGPAPVTRTVTNNTGYFAQAQLGFRDALFLTAGVRAEQNTNLGDSLGTPLSPQVGITYVRGIGETTLKVRGSWGRAIRPPAPGAKLGSVGPGFEILPNPQLGPERQQGWDAGVDVTLGARSSLSLSYFNQTAKNLISLALLAVDPVRTSQNQNVGRVKNTGIEIEGTLAFGVLQLKGVYGYARSRIENLGPGYGGLQLVGERTHWVPTHTAGASLAVEPRRGTTLTAGLAYVGSWEGLDNGALFRCQGGTGPCQPTLRGYLVTFPSFVKADAAVSQQLTRMLSGFVSVDNVTNNTSAEFTPVAPVMGRITTIGLQFRR